MQALPGHEILPNFVADTVAASAMVRGLVLQATRKNG
jgi:hypothetical protein